MHTVCFSVHASERGDASSLSVPAPCPTALSFGNRGENNQGDDARDSEAPHCSTARGVQHPAASSVQKEEWEKIAEKSLAAESRRGEMRGVCGSISPQVGLGASHSQRHSHRWTPVKTPVKTPSLSNLKPLSLNSWSEQMSCCARFPISLCLLLARSVLSYWIRQCLGGGGGLKGCSVRGVGVLPQHGSVRRDRLLQPPCCSGRPLPS